MAHTAPDPSPAELPDEPPARAPVAPRRLDASMTLLVEAMERPLDPGYAVAAERRAQGIRPGRVTIMSTAAVAVLCGLLASWAVAELRQPVPDGVTSRQALEREIERRVDQADNTARSNVEVRAQIAAAQSRLLAGAGEESLADRVTSFAAAAGEAPVSGPGLEVTLDDAPGVRVTPAPGAAANDAPDEQGRVLDRDVQIVVNGLWAAGAEAVAINAQRLSSLAAIRAAGQAIFVDNRPVLPPYVIRAIGNPTRLQSGFASSTAGPYLQGLRENFKVQAAIVAQPTLSLPGAGSLDLWYARVSP